MRFQRWCALLESCPREAVKVLETAARLAGQAFASWPGESADIAQEVIVRILDCRSAYEVSVPPGISIEAWAFGIARNVSREVRRKRLTRLLPLEGNVGDIAEPDRWDHRDNPTLTPVEAEAHLRESVRLLAELVLRLPPPDQQIAQLLSRGRTRAEIAVYLHRWRGVGGDEARRLIRRTKRALTDCWGRDPREVIPERFVKNGIWTTPPPPPKRILNWIGAVSIEPTT